MQLRGHGNGIAIALAALAVVLAGTGTAVAVTAQVVNIADPGNPAQVAHVDSTGHVATAVPLTTIIGETSVISPEQIMQLTSPTKASLAITGIVYDNGGSRQFPNSDVQVGLYKLTGGTGTSCGSDTTYLRSDVVTSGASFSQTFPNPIALRARSGQAYCIGVDLFPIDASGPTNLDLIASVNAYVASGTYTGVGTDAHPSHVTDPLVTPAHPHGGTVTPGTTATGGK